MEKPAYCYGMIAPSSLLLLEGSFPQANAYAEISESLFNIAGEAVAGAFVLSRLGLASIVDGRWLADSSESDKLIAFLESAGIDCSLLEKKPGYHPIEETVISDGHTRTIFGSYKKILFSERQWNPPSEKAIKSSSVALLDPFLGKESELGAEYCESHKVPFVSIDLSPASPISKKATALIVSEEHLLREFPDSSLWVECFHEYCARCPGLVVFTFGGEELWYALPGGGTRELKKMSPFKVDIRDTTGAGDTFRAGIAYAIAKGLGWEEGLRFACALAGINCERFPGVLKSPTLDELQGFLSRHPAH